MDGGDTTRYRG